MHNRDRLRQIRVLSERLERLPASPERDWMLGEVRRRAVDVESGVRPIPMRPLVPELDDNRPEPPRAARVTPKASVPPVPSGARPIHPRTPVRTLQPALRGLPVSSIAGAVAPMSSTETMSRIQRARRALRPNSAGGPAKSSA